MFDKPRKSGIANLSFAVVGLARNCEATIKDDVNRIASALDNSISTIWLVVESDSSDKTKDELTRLQVNIPNFEFASLGNLSERMPKRTDRIAFCRNYYAEKIRNSARFSQIDFVIVADFDGLNTHVNKSSVESCWLRDDWDMCAANQEGPYYDIWALRHAEWSPTDCWAQYRFLNRYCLDFEKNRYAAVSSKMITIPPSSEWIEVASAFGGFAVYKKEAFAHCEYLGINEYNEEFCEHVHFHQKLKATGARLFINPRLINTGYTEHTDHLRLKNRLTRTVKSKIIEASLRVIGLKRAKNLKSFFSGALVRSSKLRSTQTTAPAKIDSLSEKT